MDRIFVGFEVGTGREVHVPVFHTLITGTTQLSGKTTLGKLMARQAVDLGYKILAFDTKTNFSDFSDFGVEIPICLRETTDSLTIMGLIESIWTRNLPANYLATISEISKKATDFRSVLENAIVLEGKTKSQYKKDIAATIRELLTKLIEQTRDKHTVPRLELPHQINRITMNEFSLEGQQMIIKTAMEDALNFEKLIVLLDETSKFQPQRYRSACQRAINHYTTQGAITGNYLWMTTQYLAETSKSSMKATDVKLLGRQSHDTECAHTLDLIPRIGGIKLTNDDIMQLKLGHFFAVAENRVRLIYTVPEYADIAECREVALGRRKPSEIHFILPNIMDTEEVKKLYRERAEEVIRIEMSIKPRAHRTKKKKSEKPITPEKEKEGEKKDESS